MNYPRGRSHKIAIVLLKNKDIHGEKHLVERSAARTIAPKGVKKTKIGTCTGG
jgi:hypothetical protein